MQDKRKTSFLEKITITVEKSEKELQNEKKQAEKIKEIMLKKAIDHFSSVVKDLTVEKLYQYIQERETIGLSNAKLPQYTQENAKQLFHFILTNNISYKISILNNQFKFEFGSEIYQLADPGRLINFYGKENFEAKQTISFFQMIVLDALYFNVGADVINQFSKDSDQMLIHNTKYKIIDQVTSGLIKKTKEFCHNQMALRCLQWIKISELKIENLAIGKILSDIKMPEKNCSLVLTRQETRALNQLKEITLENFINCFPNRSEEIKNLLTEKFNSSLKEIQEEQEVLNRAKFYEHCFYYVYYFMRLVAKDNKFKVQATDSFPAFENPSYSENVLDIIESAVQAILKMANKLKDKNPGELLAKYHMVLFQNLVSEKNPENSTFQIDFMRLSILGKEAQELPKFLSIKNLNHILKEIEFLRYFWRKKLDQQKFGDEENNDKEFFNSPVKFHWPFKSQSSPVKLEKKDQGSPSKSSSFFSIDFSTDK